MQVAVNFSCCVIMYHSWLNFKVININMQLTINGNARSFEEFDFSVARLVQHLELTGKRLAIELNGEIVPRSQFEATKLADGDKLEIVGAVGGG